MKDVNKFVEEKKKTLEDCVQASQTCQKLLFTHQNHILWTNWGFSHSAATGECFQWHSNHVKTNKCRLCGLKSSGFALSGAVASLFIIKTAQKRVYLFCVKIWFKVGSQRARNTFSPFQSTPPSPDQNQFVFQTMAWCWPLNSSG